MSGLKSYSLRVGCSQQTQHLHTQALARAVEAESCRAHYAAVGRCDPHLEEQVRVHGEHLARAPNGDYEANRARVRLNVHLVVDVERRGVLIE